MNLVTAIITTHNRLELLKRAIESVLQQTYKDIELIVVDDASTDGTEEYCKGMSLHYIFIPPEESRGGNYARNRGIKVAKGKYIAFLDDDDCWLPMKIEKQVTLIESKDCELVHCGRRMEYIKDKKVFYSDSLPDSLHYGDMHKKILLTICTTTTTNILVKRQALIEVGLFDENLKFWQDYELTIRLAQRKPFFFVNEVLSIYRVDMKDKGRLTNKYYEWKKAVKYIHEKHKCLYKQLTPIERLRAHLLVMKDASIRCKSVGLSYRAYYLKGVSGIILFPFRIIDFLKRRLIVKVI